MGLQISQGGHSAIVTTTETINMTYAQRLAQQLVEAEQQAKVSYPSGYKAVVDNSKCVWQHVGKNS